MVKATRLDVLLGELARWSEITTESAPVLFWVPGRIEVLGKHTDYGGGRSLLCAVERGICIVAVRRDDSELPDGVPPLVRVRDANSDEAAEFDLSPDVLSQPGHWSNYPITVARRIAMNFSGALRGADIIFASDLPPAAGVSSSSALVVATFLALSAMNDLTSRTEYRENIKSAEDLAGYLGCVENGLDFKALHGHAGVGTFGGSEDQTAILCAIPGALVQYSFCPVRFERAIPFPVNYSFVIGASGVLAEKTGAALELYNDVSRRLSSGLECWRRTTGRNDNSMGAAIASSAAAPDLIRGALAASDDGTYSAQSLLRRFEQFHSETNEIIPRAGDALLRGDLAEFGALVGQSQAGAEESLRNQIPPTISLVRTARELGAAAASAFGAGFGGSVWALVESRSVDAFLQQWSATYHDNFPEQSDRSDFFVTRAGPPATQL